MTIKNSIKFGVILLTVVYSTIVFAQEQTNSDVSFSIPEVALIDIEPSLNNTIHFEVIAAPESGTEPVISNSTNETLWINYTSAQRNAGDKRSISAVISSGSVPDGLAVYVRASKYTGIGEGVKAGNRTNVQELSQDPVTIIRNVKNFYTGDGVGNGHLLTFTMEISDLKAVNSISDASFVVTYTLTDN